MATRSEIISAIQDHFQGYTYSQCYVGITSNIQQRLHDEHNVPKRGEGGHWIYRTADTAAIARGVEQHFIEKGMDGGVGGSRTAKIVYAYKKIPRVTKP